MGLYSYFRISKPSAERVPQERVESTYNSLRNKTFWGVTLAYSLYYVCRMSLNVVKQPLIDDGVLDAGQLGLIGSAFLFVYAVGKFMNGFIADYCNIRRFMAVGLLISSVINLVLGVLGYFHSWIPSVVIFFLFAILWGMNGWMQSMGSPPGVISLSRWFPLNKRGTYYSIFSSSPYIGEFLSFIITGVVVGAIGWEAGFVVAAIAGVVGSLIVIFFVSDTPESKGLPSVQQLSGETPIVSDQIPTRVLQKWVLKHPGIWVIAISSAFIYITKYAIAGWGVLYLQKSQGFTLEDATQIIAFSAIFGIVGTVLAGWLSDRVFKGDRVKPAILSGLVSMASLALFLFAGGSYGVNILYVSVFSLAVGVLYCIVAGLMAVDIVPRKATGAALGVVGISSYIAAGLQDITSGYLIQAYSLKKTVCFSELNELGCKVAVKADEVIYDFGPVAWFWLVAALISFLLPVLNWKRLHH